MADATATATKGDAPALFRYLALGAVVVVAIASLVVLVAYAARVLLLLFAGVVLAVLLDALTQVTMRWTRLGRKSALALVIFALAALLALGVWSIMPTAVDQVSRLLDQLPQAWSKAVERVLSVRDGVTARQLERALMQFDPGLVRPVLRSVSITVTVVGSVALIVVVGIYAAARPELYVSGFLRLMPTSWSAPLAEILRESARRLRRLLFGVGVAMVSAGLLTGVGLWLLGVPYGLGLGLLAAVLEIVPNFGPIAAAIPAVLLSFANEDVPWWQVVVLYLIVQTVQSYVIQPLVQQRMVELPPVVLIGTLVLLGWLAGPLGFLMGGPLLVVVSTALRIAYLGERPAELVATPAGVAPSTAAKA